MPKTVDRWLLLTTLAVSCLLQSAGCDTGPPPAAANRDESSVVVPVAAAPPTAQVVRKPEPEVELALIKYDPLKAAVKSHRGRVLVVEIWSES
jgi:hypothetical protein